MAPPPTETNRTTAPSATPSSRLSQRRFGSSRIFGYDFFISFKLGPPPDGAQSYASDLARALREVDYTVFFSEEEAPPGEVLTPTITRALRRSRVLVVVANSGALLKSTWVRKEVETFRAQRPNGRIIPINVNSAIQHVGPDCEASAWLSPVGTIWLDEDSQAVCDGIASPQLVRRLALAPQFLRANRLFRYLVAAIVIALALLATFAWMQRQESHDRLVTFSLAEGRQSLTNGRALDAAPSLLRALEEGSDTPDVRFMLARAMEPLDALVAVFEGSAVTFAPDGARLAVALNDGTVEVRNVLDQKVLGKFGSPSRRVQTLSFSPDGTKLLIVAAAGEVATEDDECSPGVPSANNVASLWDVQSGSLRHEIQPQGGDVCSVFFFANEGNTLAFATWSPTMTNKYWTLQTFDSNTFTPSHRTWSTEDRQCRWIDKEAGEEEGEMACPGKVVAISADGSLLAIAPWDVPERRIGVWRLADGVFRSFDLARDTEIVGAAFSLDNERLVLTTRDGVEAWDVTLARRLHFTPVDSEWLPAEISPDTTRIAVVTAERSCVVLDAANGQRIAFVAGHQARIRALRFSPDSQHLISSADDGLVKIWDSWTGRAIATLERHNNPVINLTVSPDQRLVASSDRKSVRLWSSAWAQTTRTLRDDPTRIRWYATPSRPHVVGWSTDGSRVLLQHGDFWSEHNSEWVYTLWDSSTGDLSGSWRGSKPPTMALEPPTSWTDAPEPEPPCPPGQAELATTRLLAADERVGCSIWIDQTAASHVAVLRSRAQHCNPISLGAHNAEISAAAISPDGELILTADEAGAVMIWDKFGRLLSVFAGERSPREAFFLPGGHALTLNDHNSAVMWSVSTERRPLKELKRILSCSRTADSDTMADLLREEPVDCPTLIHPPGPITTSAAGYALWSSGWHRRQDSASARSQVTTATAIFREIGDAFGEAMGTLALHTMAIARRDPGNAHVHDQRLREIVAHMRNTDGQADRLTRLGEIAFNEFCDAEVASFTYAAAIDRNPDDHETQLGQVALTLLTRDLGDDEAKYWPMARWLAYLWIKKSLAGTATEEDAFNLWNMYEGTTIDPVFERLDFRGLRNAISTSSTFTSAQAEKRDQILAVLSVLEQAGDQSNALKQLLDLPDDATPVGP